jgi:hypothetical protein
MRVSDNRDRDSVEDYLRDRIKVLEREVTILRAVILQQNAPAYTGKPRRGLAQIRIEGNTKK